MMSNPCGVGTGGGSAGGGSAVGGGVPGGGTATGGGTTSGGNTCPIPTERLRVAFPYTYLNPVVVVNLPGFPNPPCSRSGSGGNYTGYNTATVTQAWFDNNSNPVVQNLGGVLWHVDFKPEQRTLTPAELSGIASATGIPLARLPMGDRLVSETPSMAQLIGTTLPADININFFIASSTGGGSQIRFSSTNQTALVNFLNTLSQGVTLQAKMKPALGSGTWTAQFRLSTSSPYSRLTSLSQP